MDGLPSEGASNGMSIQHQINGKKEDDKIGASRMQVTSTQQGRTKAITKGLTPGSTAREKGIRKANGHLRKG